MTGTSSSFAPPSTPGGALRRWGAGWIVVALALAVHRPSLAFGFTYLDDTDLLVDDAAFLAHPGSLLGVFERSYMHVVDAEHPYYRPLVTLSYALDAQWSGARP